MEVNINISDTNDVTYICIIHTIIKNVSDIELIRGILIPFLGTSLGAACVFLIRQSVNGKLQKSFTGFAAGVMVAASVWSLIIPAVEKSEALGRFAFFPAFAGIWLGVIFLIILEKLISCLYDKGGKEDSGSECTHEVRKCGGLIKQSLMPLIAITLHNIPEGMAVGVVYAGWKSGDANITLMGAVALSIGIAVQNIPEGAIISLPLKAGGMNRAKAFLYGVLSGVVEPIGAVITIFAAGLIVPALPYLFGFAAGAMLYVVVEELIPEISQGKHTILGSLMFILGFTVMMTLDVALG